MPPDHQAALVSDIAKQMGLHLNHLMDSVTCRNVPMAAAFARAGYVIFESQIDMTWR